MSEGNGGFWDNKGIETKDEKDKIRQKRIKYDRKG